MKLHQRLVTINNCLMFNAENAVEARKRVFEIGEQLHILKSMFPSTKAFGEALEKHCPLLDVKMVSYYIRAAGHGKEQYQVEAIAQWHNDRKSLATNPRSIFEAYHKAMTQDEKKADEAEKEQEAKEQEAKAAEFAEYTLVHRFISIVDEINAATLSAEDVESIKLVASRLFRDRAEKKAA